MLYNWHIIGHEKQLKNLEKELEENNLSHAYLFAGPDKIGKFSVAKTFANILQCENNFCHSCPICVQIQKSCHYDTIEIIDDGESIKIERIRGIIHSLSLSAQGKYKILLMQNIERMTLEAMNALLKTLEEPPPNVMFLLTTNDLKSVKNTIISRVRLYKFHLVAKDILGEALRKRYPEIAPDMHEKILSFSLGKPGKAIALLEDSELLQFYQKTYNDLEMFVRNPDIVKQFFYMDMLIKDPQKTKIFFDIFLHFIRHLLLSCSGKGKQNEMNHLTLLVKEIEKTKEFIGKNINARLALENLMLKLTH